MLFSAKVNSPSLSVIYNLPSVKIHKCQFTTIYTPADYKTIDEDVSTDDYVVLYGNN